MSEYIKVTPVTSDDPNKMILRTNLVLLEEQVEEYLSREKMEEGSALAQTLAPIEGITRIRIEESNLILWKHEMIPWHLIIAEATVALKEFFL